MVGQQMRRRRKRETTETGDNLRLFLLAVVVGLPVLALIVLSA